MFDILHDKSVFRQNINPVHREGNGSPVLFYAAGQNIGPVKVQHVAETVIDFGEKSGFDDSGFIFKG